MNPDTPPEIDRDQDDFELVEEPPMVPTDARPPKEAQSNKEQDK